MERENQRRLKKARIDSSVLLSSFLGKLLAGAAIRLADFLLG